MAVLDDMDAKLDTLISLMGEEVNIHPDSLRPEASPAYATLPLTTSSSVPLQVEFRVEDREGGRYLVMRLRDQMGYWAINRAWRCVYRDPMQPMVLIDRPGMYGAWTEGKVK